MPRNQLPPIPVSEYKKFEDERYNILERMPKGFKPTDPKTVGIFCFRMKKIRTDLCDENKSSAKNQYPSKTHHKFPRQEDLAQVLGVVAMTICKYESYEKDEETNTYRATKIKRIPTKHLRRICTFYNVTPHYLVGYVDNPNEILWLDDEGNIVKDNAGKQRLLTEPMTFKSAHEVSCLEEYNNLAFEDSELYSLINKLLLSDKRKKELCKEVLSAIFKYS